MTDHDAVSQARTAVARACGALDAAVSAFEDERRTHGHDTSPVADGLREVVAELEATGAWLRTLDGAPVQPEAITVVPGDGQPYPCDRWRATRRLPDGKHRVAWGPTPEAAVARLFGRVVASVDPTMLGVR